MPLKTDEVRAKQARARAEATFKKEERAREGAEAMKEYQANYRAVRENMAQLRALRLAKEAADKGKKASAKTAAKAAK